MIQSFSFKKEYVAYVAVLLFGLFLSAMAAHAASTISTNISTDGTLAVTGVSTLTGTVTTGGNVKVPAGYGLDVVANGALNLGTTTATSVVIGSVTANVGIASSSPYVALGVTGTTTASAGMVIGAKGSGITQLLFGTCTVTAGSITASTTLSVSCAATGVTTGDRVFVTPYITEDRNISFVSASSTAANVIQVILANRNITGVGAVDPTDNVWSWMAIK